MPLRSPSLLQRIVDKVGALAGSDTSEGLERDAGKPTLRRERHQPRPVPGGDAAATAHLANGTGVLPDATGDDGRAAKSVDDLSKGLHRDETLQDVAHNVNTNGNAAAGTLQSVTTQGERLILLQKAAGFSTLAEFARAARIEPGTARQQANRDSIPTDAAARYVSAARGTGASVEWLLLGTGQPPRNVPKLTMQEPPAVLPAQTATAALFPAGRPDLPVWAAAQAGEDGAIVLTPDPIDHIHRSERMLGVRNPFAFYVIGSSMSPAIEHGDQVVINPSIPVRTGRDCVFIQDQEDGSMLALVKRLLRPGPDTWRVRQFDPAKDFELSRRKWSRAYVIAEIRRGGL